MELQAGERICLIDVCGQQSSYRQQFLECLKGLNLEDEYYNLLLAAWDHGHKSCDKQYHDAIRSGRIEVMVNSGWEQWAYLG